MNQKGNIAKVYTPVSGFGVPTKQKELIIMIFEYMDGKVEKFDSVIEWTTTGQGKFLEMRIQKTQDLAVYQKAIRVDAIKSYEEYSYTAYKRIKLKEIQKL